MSVKCKRRVTTGEYQPQPVVRYLLEFVLRLLDGFNQLPVRFQLLAQTGLAAKSIDGFVFGGLDDPGAGKFGYAILGLVVDRCREGLLGRSFATSKSPKSRISVARIRPHSAR